MYSNSGYTHTLHDRLRRRSAVLSSPFFWEMNPMWKAVTFIGVVTTMAALGSLIFLVEKADTGEEWAVMAMWFALCDWLPPTSRANTDTMTIGHYEDLDAVGKSRARVVI